MGRWEPDARGRLEKAALDLYLERGYEKTTVAEIAERAGLTERTFFRHFADKREVLFGGSAMLEDLLVTAVVGAPASCGPLEAVALALDGAGALIQQRGPVAKKRQAVIAANPELRERELIKMASWAVALTNALHERGVLDPAARLAAESGIAAFRVAFEHWIEQPTRRNLPSVFRETLDRLRSVAARRA
ncbi:MAG TPA: helix-turn-helix domain-containing protein [Acidimicrobiales bacterium]|nr:helix-turn-helix domain-containing protein [Acidimicrobiales bacterium]